MFILFFCFVQFVISTDTYTTLHEDSLCLNSHTLAERPVGSTYEACVDFMLEAPECNGGMIFAASNEDSRLQCFCAMDDCTEVVTMNAFTVYEFIPATPAPSTSPSIEPSVSTTSFVPTVCVTNSLLCGCGEELNDEAIAGRICSVNGLDSNRNYTERQCDEVDGMWMSFTCSDAEWFKSQELMGDLFLFAYQPYEDGLIVSDDCCVEYVEPEEVVSTEAPGISYDSLGADDRCQLEWHDTGGCIGEPQYFFTFDFSAGDDACISLAEVYAENSDLNAHPDDYVTKDSHCWSAECLQCSSNKENSYYQNFNGDDEGLWNLGECYNYANSKWFMVMDCRQGSVRFSEGDTGRPEIYYLNQWVPICSRIFTETVFGPTLFCQAVGDNAYGYAVVNDYEGSQMNEPGYWIGGCDSSSKNFQSCLGGCNMHQLGGVCERQMHEDGVTPMWTSLASCDAGEWNSFEIICTQGSNIINVTMAERVTSGTCESAGLSIEYDPTRCEPLFVQLNNYTEYPGPVNLLALNSGAYALDEWQAPRGCSYHVKDTANDQQGFVGYHTTLIRNEHDCSEDKACACINETSTEYNLYQMCNYGTVWSTLDWLPTCEDWANLFPMQCLKRAADGLWHTDCPFTWKFEACIENCEPRLGGAEKDENTMVDHCSVEYIFTEPMGYAECMKLLATWGVGDEREDEYDFFDERWNSAVYIPDNPLGWNCKLCGGDGMYFARPEAVLMTMSLPFVMSMSEYLASDPSSNEAVSLENYSGERIIYAANGFLCPTNVDHATAEVICRYFDFDEVVSMEVVDMEPFKSAVLRPDLIHERGAMSIKCQDSSMFWMDCKLDWISTNTYETFCTPRNQVLKLECRRTNDYLNHNIEIRGEDGTHYMGHDIHDERYNFLEPFVHNITHVNYASYIDLSQNILIENVTFSGENVLPNSDRRHPAVVTITDSEVTFKDCTFFNSPTAIEFFHSNVTLINCHFENIRESFVAGQFQDSTLTVRNSHFGAQIGNPQYGGHIRTAGDVYIYDSYFTHGISYEYGANIYSEGSLYVRNTEFVNGLNTNFNFLRAKEITLTGVKIENIGDLSTLDQFNLDHYMNDIPVAFANIYKSAPIHGAIVNLDDVQITSGEHIYGMGCVMAKQVNIINSNFAWVQLPFVDVAAFLDQNFEVATYKDFGARPCVYLTDADEVHVYAGMVAADVEASAYINHIEVTGQMVAPIASVIQDMDIVVENSIFHHIGGSVVVARGDILMSHCVIEEIQVNLFSGPVVAAIHEERLIHYRHDIILNDVTVRNVYDKPSPSSWTNASSLIGATAKSLLIGRNSSGFMDRVALGIDITDSIFEDISSHSIHPPVNGMIVQLTRTDISGVSSQTTHGGFTHGVCAVFMTNVDASYVMSASNGGVADSPSIFVDKSRFENIHTHLAGGVLHGGYQTEGAHGINGAANPVLDSYMEGDRQECYQKGWVPLESFGSISVISSNFTQITSGSGGIIKSWAFTYISNCEFQNLENPYGIIHSRFGGTVEYSTFRDILSNNADLIESPRGAITMQHSYFENIIGRIVLAGTELLMSHCTFQEPEAIAYLSNAIASPNRPISAHDSLDRNLVIRDVYIRDGALITPYFSVASTFNGTLEAAFSNVTIINTYSDNATMVASPFALGTNPTIYEGVYLSATSTDSSAERANVKMMEWFGDVDVHIQGDVEIFCNESAIICSTSQSIICETCGDNSYTIGDTYLQILNVPKGGYFGLADTFYSNAKCWECPVGGRCNGSKVIHVDDNYYPQQYIHYYDMQTETQCLPPESEREEGYEVSAKQIELYRCPLYYCKWDDKAHTYDGCADGREGMLCGTCKDGYSQSWDSVDCVKNDECNAFSAPLITQILCTGFAALLILNSFKNDDNGSLTDAMYTQLIVVMQLLDCVRLPNKTSFDVIVDVAAIFSFSFTFEGSMKSCIAPDMAYREIALIKVGSLILVFFWVMLITMVLHGRCTNGEDLKRLIPYYTLIFFYLVEPFFTTTTKLTNCIGVKDDNGENILVSWYEGTTECYTPDQIVLMSANLFIILIIFFVMMIHSKRGLFETADDADVGTWGITKCWNRRCYWWNQSEVMEGITKAMEKRFRTEDALSRLWRYVLIYWRVALVYCARSIPDPIISSICVLVVCLLQLIYSFRISPWAMGTIPNYTWAFGVSGLTMLSVFQLSTLIVEDSNEDPDSSIFHTAWVATLFTTLGGMIFMCAYVQINELFGRYLQPPPKAILNETIRDEYISALKADGYDVLKRKQVMDAINLFNPVWIKTEKKSNSDDENDNDSSEMPLSSMGVLMRSLSGRHRRQKSGEHVTYSDHETYDENSEDEVTNFFDEVEGGSDDGSDGNETWTEEFMKGSVELGSLWFDAKIVMKIQKKSGSIGMDCIILDTELARDYDVRNVKLVDVKSAQIMVEGPWPETEEERARRLAQGNVEEGEESDEDESEEVMLMGDDVDVDSELGDHGHFEEDTVEKKDESEEIEMVKKDPGREKTIRFDGIPIID